MWSIGNENERWKKRKEKKTRKPKMSPRSINQTKDGKNPFIISHSLVHASLTPFLNCAASLVAGYPPSKRTGRVRFPGGATLLSEWSSGLRRVTRNHILETGRRFKSCFRRFFFSFSFSFFFFFLSLFIVGFLFVFLLQDYFEGWVFSSCSQIKPLG